MAQLTIKIDAKNGAIVLDRVLTLGSEYEIIVVGVTGDLDLLIANHSGETIAASLDGTLSLATLELREEFSTVHGCPMAKVFHLYAYSASAVVADADILIKWTPYEFTAVGLPISLKGDRGEPGESAYLAWLALPENAGKTEADFVAWLKGQKGDKGDDGENGAYVPMAEMYAFSVDIETGHLIIRAQDADKLFAVDGVGNPDYTKPLFVLTPAGHIAYQFWDNGNVVQSVDLGLVKGDTGAAFTYDMFTGPQLAALKGDPGNNGADGLTEAQVQTVVEAYGYATASAVGLKADASAIVDMATQTAVNAALVLKQNKLTWDVEPTTGSANAVSSGVLKTQFDAISSTIANAVGLNVDETKSIIHSMFAGLATTKPTSLFETELRVQEICKLLTGTP